MKKKPHYGLCRFRLNETYFFCELEKNIVEDSLFMCYSADDSFDFKAVIGLDLPAKIVSA